MKKNMLSIVMIALLVVNIVLNVVLLFAVVPNASKTNNLIKKVASAVDLQIEEESDGSEDYSIADLKSYTFTSDSLTITLKKNDDGKDHYAVITGISLSLNSKAEDYDTISQYITNNEIKIKDKITSVFSKYTKDEAQSKVDSIKKEILDELSSESCLNSKVVVEVNFGNLAFQ